MSCNSETFLHIDWNAMEDAERLSAGLRFVGFFGLSESVFAKLVNERVELRIIAIDAREHAFGEFERGNLFFADGFGSLEG
jgi:hypothetical protein